MIPSRICKLLCQNRNNEIKNNPVRGLLIIMIIKIKDKCKEKRDFTYFKNQIKHCKIWLNYDIFIEIELYFIY